VNIVEEELILVLLSMVTLQPR